MKYPRRYEYQQHDGSGDVYAVTYDDWGYMDGVYGPVEHHEQTAGNLPDFDYSPEDVEWLLNAPTHRVQPVKEN